MAELGYILQGFEVYTNGFGKAGSGENCEVPFPEKVMEDFRGGGMLMGRKYALGYKPMTFKAEFSAYDPQILALGGLVSGNDVPFSVRGWFDGDRNQKVEARIMMRGDVVKADPGKWEAGKKTKLNLEVTLRAAKLTVGSTLIYDIDAEFDVYNVGGVDEMTAKLRAAGVF